MDGVASPMRLSYLTASEKRNFRNGVLFAFPIIIGLALFVIYPVAMSLYYSLTNYDAIRHPAFIGMRNYATLLTKDAIFARSIQNTLYMVLIALPLGMIINFAIALLLNTKIKFLAVYRTLFYLPSITPAVATAMLWLWILNPQYGLLNSILYKLGIIGPGWLSDPAWSKPSLILMGLWRGGNAILIYLAGLQDVPKELYEAAEIDGAKSLARTVHITLPMVSPVIFFNLIMGLIGYFQYFTEAYIMTYAGAGQLGGPAESTMFYATYLYQNAFMFFKMGYASAQAWILYILILLCTVLLFRTSSWVYYRGM
ncbi:MAG: sugar ABC transporter permease [Firmicutes bacterium]|nr:sugar ABC transporter permease [Bacillota bacterium]